MDLALCVEKMCVRTPNHKGKMSGFVGSLLLSYILTLRVLRMVSIKGSIHHLLVSIYIIYMQALINFYPKKG